MTPEQREEADRVDRMADELAELRELNAEMLLELEWVSRCASFAMPAGIKAYAISDEHMAKIKSLLAKAKP